MGIFIGGTGLLGLAIVVVVILIKVLSNATATRCAACMSVVHPQATICPHCGTGRKPVVPHQLNAKEAWIVVGVVLVLGAIFAVTVELLSR